MKKSREVHYHTSLAGIEFKTQTNLEAYWKMDFNENSWILITMHIACKDIN